MVFQSITKTAVAAIIVASALSGCSTLQSAYDSTAETTKSVYNSTVETVSGWFKSDDQKDAKK